LFYSLSDDVKKQLYPKLQTVFYNTNNVVVKEGDKFDCIYLVTNGSITKTAKSMAHSEIITKNKYWGNTALAKNSKVHLGTYIAAEPSTVMKINIDVLKTLMPQVYDTMSKGTGVDASDIRLSDKKTTADKRTAAMEKRRSSLKH
jgi:signal-transduction protein with cAMP-binding, CBS, and nucleotidyltransferase domain